MTVRPPFTRSFTQQAPLPEEAVAAATEVLSTARLHRYDAGPDGMSEAARLEHDFAAWQGARHCLALASGGQALQIALRAAGVCRGEQVLTNAFTLAPVPGAIAAVGAEPLLVETTEDLVIDLDDLAAKAGAARVLLLSHMRGHLCDMEALAALAARAGITVIEDCAHTMGARWNGVRAGNFGLAGCFSTQTYKHINSGEGGLLTSDDPAFMARATILSGSYMLYDRHGAGPPPEAFAVTRLDTPNMSARMDNLRAAILRPQLADLETAVERWNALHDRLVSSLAESPAIHLPQRPPQALRVGSSVQFSVPCLGADEAAALVGRLADRGIALKWIGAPEPAGYTSTHASWHYVPAQSLPQTNRVLATLFDMRLPLTFEPEDCDLIAEHILDAVAELSSEATS